MDTTDKELPEFSEPESDTDQNRTGTKIDAFGDSSAAKTSAWEGQSCPRLLRMTSNGIQATAAFVGITVGIVISLAIFSTAPPKSVLGRMFDLQNVQGMLPLIMVGMFSWGIMLCLMRRLRIRHVEKVVGSDMAADLGRDMKSVPLVQLLAQVENSRVADASPLLRRIRIVLRQWLAKPSLRDSLSLLDQQAVSDGEDIQHAYGVVKTFIWALPVLGLIGTVVGIALAVGDFGSVVGGNVDDVAVIKSSLVQVTAGLSFAFTTTLLGLLGALLLVLPSSALQAREEKIVTKTESVVSDLFLPELQRLYPEHTTRSAIPDAKQLRETLVEIAQVAVQAAGAATNKVLHDAEVRFAEWQQRVASESQQSAHRVSEAAANIGKELAKTSDEFLTRLSLIRESMDQQVAGFREGIERGVASSTEIARKLDAAMEKHDRGTTEVSSLMEQLLASSNVLLKGHIALTRSMVGVTQGDMAKTIASLAQTMSDVARQNEVVRQALETMAEATQRVTTCQQSLQANLQRMESMGWTVTLDDLGKTLRHVSEVLQQFQEPVVFQAVRVSSVMGKETVAQSKTQTKRSTEE